ncbi:hypothetical protein D9M70_349300 [compost metagenome]
MKTVKIATEPGEIEEAFEFRYRFMCKWNRYIADQGAAKNSIGDAFDTYTDYVVCKEYDVIKGVVRLIRPNAHGFFMDQFVDPRPYLDGRRNVIELSEYITHPEFRRDTSIISSLIRGSFDHVKDKGYEAAVSISVRSMHRLVESLGFVNTGVSFTSGWKSRMTMFVLTDPQLAFAGVHRYLGVSR